MTALQDLSPMPTFQLEDFSPKFSFQPATPSAAFPSEQASSLPSEIPFDNITFVREDRSPTPGIGPNGASTPAAISGNFDISDAVSEAGSYQSHNSNHASSGAAGLLAFSQSMQGGSNVAHSPDIMNAVSPVLSSSSLPFNGVLPAMPTPHPGASGPIRNRRGKHDKSLSINSQSSSGLSFDFIRDDSPSNGQLESEEGQEGEGARTITMGDHAFTIPLKSPTIAPQLQASVRVTSTGKPSHARKVPEGHVKRPRNAFILFRSYACTNNLLPTSLGITDHRQVSRVVGQLWKGLKPEEKSIWEKKALEEKEEHKRNNPNYRYRPVFNRREVPAKKRRRKPAEDEEIEDEERKCKVVARVLLEGRDVSNEQLEQEVEQQKIQDQIDGRERGRSRSRSRSINKQGNHLDVGYSLSRPGSAPPHDDEMDYYGDTHLRATKKAVTRTKRSKTLATSNADYMLPPPNSLYPGLYGNQPVDYSASPFGMPSRFPSMPPAMSPNIVAPSPRSAANMQSLFAAGDPSMTDAPFTGFKAGLNDNLSLVSPSFSRKFSLGRWEVPYQPSSSLFDSNSGPNNAQNVFGSAYAANDGSSGSSNGSGGQHNYTYESQPNAPQPFAQPSTQQPAPTYVYLSKQDAQNPEIVNHYLSQGYGVSYDA